MKIKLINNGSFEGLKDVAFPVEVEASVSEDGLYVVSFKDIMSIPRAFWCEDDTEEGTKYSFFEHEIEVVK